MKGGRGENSGVLERKEGSKSRGAIVGDMYHIDNIVTTEVRKRKAGLLERMTAARHDARNEEIKASSIIASA